MAPHTHIPAPRNTIETYSARPDREPPRNENGEIICQHEACRDKSEVFRRPCEWNKHMDKHERPYKCNEPTCEQNPGFTYSGGLLRHMREVHKKGVGPARRPLYCPHANCIRSTGEGFTRRENLEEHLRRRHSYTGHYSPPPQSSDSNNEETQDHPRKRRKTTEPESPNDEQTGQTMQNAVQHLSESRRESSRGDLQSMIDDRLLTNGNDAELDRAEAIRQLALARQTIVDQQEIIRRQDHELHNLRSNAADVSPGAAYSTRPPDRSFTATANAPGVLPIHPQLQQESYMADSAASGLAINGSSLNMAGQDLEGQSQQQKVDKDTQSNGNEPSRRIEIARDLVSEKMTSKAP